MELCVQGPDGWSVRNQKQVCMKMATHYGVQFEALMAEVCRDFGARLIRSWDREASKEEVKKFVAEAVVNFFKLTTESTEEPLEEVEDKSVDLEPEPVKKAKKAPKAKGKAVEVTVEVEKPKAKAKAKGKKKAEPEPEPEPEVEEEPKAKGKKPVVAKGKGKEVKPKCQAVTAKGAPCSKCAIEGEVFCSVHLKKAPATEASTSKAKKPVVAKGKGKGGKGIAKVSPPKHTHSLTSPPLKENPCELCDTHGMPFEVPEYEEDKPEEAEAEAEVDPDFVLGEEEFEEDSEDESVEEDFEELD